MQVGEGEFDETSIYDASMLSHDLHAGVTRLHRVLGFLRDRWEDAVYLVGPILRRYRRGIIVAALIGSVIGAYIGRWAGRAQLRTAELIHLPFAPQGDTPTARSGWPAENTNR